jgi:hypothetical protein
MMILAVALSLASSLIASGGGPGSYSTVRAFSGMVGQENVLADQHQLALMDGQDNADHFIPMFDYAVGDAWRLAGKNNLTMPPPQAMQGRALAAQLLQAGMQHGQFDTTIFFSQLFGEKIAAQIFTDVDTHYGPGSSVTFARMGNHFFTGVGSLLANNSPGT